MQTNELIIELFKENFYISVLIDLEPLVVELETPTLNQPAETMASSRKLTGKANYESKDSKAPTKSKI